MRSAADTPRRPAMIVGTIAILLWALLPMSTASAQPGPPDHAGEAQRPHHSHDPGQPDHAQGRNEAPATPATDAADERSRNETAPNRAPRAEDVRGGQQGEDARAGAPGQTRRVDGEARPSADRQDETAGSPSRGSVKLRTTGEETWPPRTEPHVGCEFWIHFHGFDAGERGFSLHAWSPTGDQQLVYRGSVPLTEARGNAYSGIYPPDPGHGLTLDDLVLDPSWPGDHEPHDQQGWHLRLEVDGPKHKMFWVDCAPDQPANTDGTGSSGDVEGNASEVEGTATERFGIGGGDPEDEAAVLGVILSNSGDVFGIGGALASGDGDARILGAPAVTGDSALPVTGAQLLWLVVIGLLLAATGARLTARGTEQR